MYGWNQRRSAVDHSWHGGIINYSDNHVMDFSKKEWREYPSLPVGIDTAQAVWLDNTLYVGGGFCTTEGYKREDASLYFIEPGRDTVWETIRTPTHQYGLVVHKHEVLLVGGIKFPTRRQLTKKIYTLRNEDFDEVLPQMKMEREALSAISTGDVLVVAGGRIGNSMISSVDFLKHGQWFSAHSLPKAGCLMRSCSEGDQWCLLNGEIVHTVSLSMLVKSNVNKRSPWKSHTVEVDDSAVALVGGQLLSIGGNFDSEGSTTISAFSTASQSWIHVVEADMPHALQKCTVTKSPTGELLVIGGWRTEDNDIDEPLSNDIHYINNERLLTLMNDQIEEFEATIFAVEKTEGTGKYSIQEQKQVKKLSLSQATPSLDPIDATPKQVSNTFDLPGVKVDGRTSFVVTNTAACFSWDDYGLTLDVPENSLPVGLPECTLDLISSSDGKYLLPPDHEAFSPVYWVRPTPPFSQFKKPLTLKIEHCAKTTSTTKLTFLKASCAQKNLPYNFEVVEKGGSFSASTSFGSLEVSRFSGYLLSWLFGWNEKSYTGRIFCRSLAPRVMDIFFVIALNHSTSNKNMKAMFEEKLQAEEKLSFDIEFESDKISLDIPQDGVTVGSWMLEPLVNPPEIQRTSVDFATKSGSDLKYQKLLAKLPSHHTVPLDAYTHPIKLTGAKTPSQVKIVLNAFTPDSPEPVDQRGLSALQFHEILSDDQLNTPLTDQDCVIVAPYFHGFEFYIDFFGLDNSQKVDVKNRGIDKNELAIAHLLKCWRMKFNRAATFKELLHILSRLGEVEIIQRVCKYVQKSIATLKTPVQDTTAELHVNV